ncbi:MAG: 30S ribosomal protein S7 [Candidatus Goldbacteria bacterium]|nr:30S ribosomal protein S7 [Candidatus Goldiibacteriota bacterium]HPD18762.1 30S ribosomal protein S7 [Candidatus Goldiibacteriota bacterium]
MPRRRRVIKREIIQDSKYNNQIVARIINCIMMKGKKSIAEKLTYDAFDIIKKQGKDPLETCKQAVENVKPLLELKTRRIGGSNYQIPVEVPPERMISLAVRWIINATHERKERGFDERLAAELLAAASNQGGAVKKKEDVHKMAEANKAYAHFRW